MIRLDEGALVEFFGVVPESRTVDEREFFAALSFIKRVDGLQITVSISAHFDDLRFTLRHHGTDPVVDATFTEVASVSIEQDGGARRWLRVRTRTQGMIEISVEPTIVARITAGDVA